ncbi:hypothetical protein Tco_0143841, partial [Tanacetum coccineum]
CMHASNAPNEELEAWNAQYNRHNEVACLMLCSMSLELQRQFENYKKGQSVSSYVLKMKSYLEQLERLGYVLPQDITIGLIYNGLSNDFFGFVKNYNMHNMGKTIGKLNAMLIKYEKGLPKKVDTPQFFAIQGGSEESVKTS